MASALRPVGHEDRLSLVEHLTELRVRIVICLIAFVAATVFCMVENNRILDILNHPLTSTVKPGVNDPIAAGSRFDQELAGYLKRSGDVQRRLAAGERDPALKQELLALANSGDRVAASVPPASEKKPVTLGVAEPFMQTLKVSAYAGLLISLPLLLFQVYSFVLPAFSPREKEVALPAMLGIPFLFVGGVVFGYFTVVPSAIRFLQNFNADAFDILIQAQPYYKFVLMLLIAMGLLFQIPVAIVAVTRVGIVSTRQLARNRRYAILVIAVLAMLLPGQDPVTMTLLMLPMYVLFEGSILLSWLLDRRSARNAGADALDEDESGEDESFSPEPVHVTRDQD